MQCKMGNVNTHEFLRTLHKWQIKWKKAHLFFFLGPDKRVSVKRGQDATASWEKPPTLKNLYRSVSPCQSPRLSQQASEMQRDTRAPVEVRGAFNRGAQWHFCQREAGRALGARPVAPIGLASPGRRQLSADSASYQPLMQLQFLLLERH